MGNSRQSEEGRTLRCGGVVMTLGDASSTNHSLRGLRGFGKGFESVRFARIGVERRPSGIGTTTVVPRAALQKLQVKLEQWETAGKQLMRSKFSEFLNDRNRARENSS